MKPSAKDIAEKKREAMAEQEQWPVAIFGRRW
jgi:hypothetical protein